MPLLGRDGTPRGEAPPLAVPDEAPIPEAGPFTLSSARFLAERGRLSSEDLARAGVHLEPDEDVEALASLLAEAPLIALTFPKLRDGRAFSQARLLRGRLRYRGPLIARGPVLPDQLVFLARCGFDLVEVGPEADPSVWQAAAKRHRHHLQPAFGDAAR